jgi:hypothetical protein
LHRAPIFAESRRVFTRKRHDPKTIDTSLPRYQLFLCVFLAPITVNGALVLRAEPLL